MHPAPTETPARDLKEIDMRWHQDLEGNVRLFDRLDTLIARIEPTNTGWRWEVLRAGKWQVDDAANPIDFGEQQTLSAAQECVADSLGLDARGIDGSIGREPSRLTFAIEAAVAYGIIVAVVGGIAAAAWFAFWR